MGKLRRGGFVFLGWIGDDGPKHAHVHRNGRLVVKWDLDHDKAMAGAASRRILDLKDPSYLRDMLVYRLSIEVQHRVASAGLSKREIIRRLGTSATQFYRLLDQTNYAKSVDQLLRLLSVLDCEVEFIVHAKTA